MDSFSTMSDEKEPSIRNNIKIIKQDGSSKKQIFNTLINKPDDKDF